MKRFFVCLLMLAVVGCGTREMTPELSQAGASSVADSEVTPLGSPASAAEGTTQEPEGTPQAPESTNQESTVAKTTLVKKEPAVEVVTLGAGCFWCIEAVLEQIEGINEVTSGYMGGTIKNPTYEQICTGLTGHAEVVQVTFDPQVIEFAAVLEHFWKLHDPTTLNQQGYDVGTQ